MREGSENPWQDLSLESPYIAKQDKSSLDHLIDFELTVLPDPYLGNLNDAKVVCLLKNPGYQEGDAAICCQGKFYFSQNRASLLHQSDPPFYVLDERVNFSGGYIWWRRILNRIFNDSGMETSKAMKAINRNLMCVQYFPYHSTTWLGAPRIPSQNYSFDLVRQAIKEKKKIILMRSEGLWLEAVPELRGQYVKIINYRNPALSPANLGEKEFLIVMRLLLS